MEVDAETLISLIENRPAIYDYTLKEHHLRDFIDKLWEEIANEIKATVAECKSKWTILRNSFTRALREEKCPSGSGKAKRKKWYLMDSMLFLKDYVGQHKKQDGNFADSVQNVQEYEVMYNYSETSNQEQSAVDVVFDITDSPPSNSPTTPKIRKKASDIVAQPLVDFLKAKTQAKEESQHSLFFKSLLPDVEKLRPLYQRQFKESVMSILNQYVTLNEEESA